MHHRIGNLCLLSIGAVVEFLGASHAVGRCRCIIICDIIIVRDIVVAIFQIRSAQINLVQLYFAKARNVGDGFGGFQLVEMGGVGEGGGVDGGVVQIGAGGTDGIIVIDVIGIGIVIVVIGIGIGIVVVVV